jgi:hypothetical protein
MGPDYVQEVGSLEWMLKKAWVEFHHLPSLYCMIANLRQPSADLVIMTERGLGILELKHVQGIITIGKDDIWYAGRTIIHAGFILTLGAKFKNMQKHFGQIYCNEYFHLQ